MYTVASTRVSTYNGHFAILYYNFLPYTRQGYCQSYNIIINELNSEIVFSLQNF